MNKPSIQISVFALLLGVFSNAYAGVSALAAELYDVSGLKQQIALIPDQTERSFDVIALSQSMPLEFERLDQQAVREAVPQSFSEERLREAMLGSLVKVPEDELQRMVNWFGGELGQKVKAAELGNSLISNAERFEKFRTDLEANPVSDTRRDIADRLDLSLGISESAADTLINIQIGFTLSIMAAAGENLAVDDYVQSIKENRTSIVEAYRSDSLHAILFIYQDLTDSELSQFTDAMVQGAARHYVVATNDGIANGMLAASSRLGTAIGEMFKAESTQQGI